MQEPGTTTLLHNFVDLLKGFKPLLDSTVTAINMGKTLMMKTDLVDCPALWSAQKRRFGNGWQVDPS